jgi:NADH-quinone oxidoreductase subunit J
MMLFAAATSSAIGQLAIAALLGAIAIYWLLPRPRGRSVAFGSFAAIACAAVLASWVLRHFGDPARDRVEQILFWLFGGSSLFFATIFVAQRNPARGAIAFAFVILSVCGLFLLLAAPFLMAATIIIYAGAIIVTFLFVLMLSHQDGPSDENDRTRDPLLGSLAGFGFLGLVLFALYQGSPSAAADAEVAELPIPARAMSGDDRIDLLAAAEQMRDADQAKSQQEFTDAIKSVRAKLTSVIGTGSATRGAPERLSLQTDPRSVAVRKHALELRQAINTTFDGLDRTLTKPQFTENDLLTVKAQLLTLRGKVLLFSGRGELPARNVANVGYALYSDYLLAVEMAGTILLVATIGAVAIAGRKEATT